MDIAYKPINLEMTLELCVSFRRETHEISFGNLDTYNEKEVRDWFQRFSEENERGFKHIYVNGDLAGQLEFKSPISESGIKFGYIYLIYLKEEFRGKGIGNEAQEYVFDRFKADGCEEARLRYIPGNIIAEPFYTYTGWVKSGDVGPRGQLLIRRFA